MLFSSNR